MKEFDEKDLIDLGKHQLCQQCLTLKGDHMETIECDIAQDVREVLFDIATKENVTVNAVVTRTLMQHIKMIEEEKS